MQTIILEGVNGAGKTTIGALLRDRFVSDGRSCVVADPARLGRLGPLERRHLVSSAFEHSPEVDALLFTSLRLDGTHRLLQRHPELADGVLILERWSLALAAYGAVDGVSTRLVEVLQTLLDDAIRPDVTVLLDVPPEVARARLADVKEENRFQSRGVDYFRALSAAHLACRVTAGDRIVIDASKAINETLEEVLGTLTGRLAR